MEDVNKIHLVQDSVLGRDLLNTEMNLRVQKMAGNFLTS